MTEGFYKHSVCPLLACLSQNWVDWKKNIAGQNQASSAGRGCAALGEQSWNWQGEASQNVQPLLLPSELDFNFGGKFGVWIQCFFFSECFMNIHHFTAFHLCFMALIINCLLRNQKFSQLATKHQCHGWPCHSLHEADSVQHPSLDFRCHLAYDARAIMLWNQERDYSILQRCTQVFAQHSLFKGQVCSLWGLMRSYDIRFLLLIPGCQSKLVKARQA